MVLLPSSEEVQLKLYESIFEHLEDIGINLTAIQQLDDVPKNLHQHRIIQDLLYQVDCLFFTEHERLKEKMNGKS